MFLVLLIHYIPYRELPSSTSLNSDIWGTLFNLELRSLSFVCVNCFILISGYFGIHWKWKSILNLLFQILFWSLFAIGLNMLVEGNGSIAYFLKTMWSDWTARWFITSYLGLYLIAPIINTFIGKASIKELGILVALFYVFSTVWGWFGKVADFNEGMSVLSLLGLYLLGAFIRKSESVWLKYKAWIYLLGYLLVGLVLIGISVLTLSVGIGKSVYGYLNPLVIVASCLLFQFCNRLEIGKINVINWISSSAFAVYLFHTSYAIYVYYGQCCRYIEDNFSYSFGVAMCFLLCLFAVIVLIDKIRIFLFDKLQSGFGGQQNESFYAPKE